MQLDKCKHRIKLFLGGNLAECSHNRYRFKNWHNRPYASQQYLIFPPLWGGEERGYIIMGNDGKTLVKISQRIWK